MMTCSKIVELVLLEGRINFWYRRSIKSAFTMFLFLERYKKKEVSPYVRCHSYLNLQPVNILRGRSSQIRSLRVKI